MSLYPSDTLSTFIAALRDKTSTTAIASHSHPQVRFLDEDGDMVTLRDEGDYEAALDVARCMRKGRAEGKLEIWVGGED